MPDTTPNWYEGAVRAYNVRKTKSFEENVQNRLDNIAYHEGKIKTSERTIEKEKEELRKLKAPTDRTFDWLK